jgi:hypothetical protein
VVFTPTRKVADGLTSQVRCKHFLVVSDIYMNIYAIDWIPAYLHPDTQAALRVEMEKPAGPKDEPGYIYA